MFLYSIRQSDVSQNFFLDERKEKKSERERERERVDKKDENITAKSGVQEGQIEIEVG